MGRSQPPPEARKNGPFAGEKSRIFRRAVWRCLWKDGAVSSWKVSDSPEVCWGPPLPRLPLAASRRSVNKTIKRPVGIGSARQNDLRLTEKRSQPSLSVSWSPAHLLLHTGPTQDILTILPNSGSFALITRPPPAAQRPEKYELSPPGAPLRGPAARSGALHGHAGAAGATGSVLFTNGPSVPPSATSVPCARSPSWLWRAAEGGCSAACGGRQPGLALGLQGSLWAARPRCSAGPTAALGPLFLL